jgi:O-antigen ligase
VVTALGVVVTAAAGLAYLRLTRTARDTQPLRLPARARRVALIATVPVLLGIAVVIALSAEQTVHIPTSATRLVKFEANRKAYWRVALETFADHPVAGVGTASYQVEWRRKRTNADFVSDAHSLYLETLAELGIVGALLLAALYATATTGLVRGARAAPGDPALAAAAAVLAAFAIHAGVDWNWEMPAVTLPALIMAAVAVQRPFRIPS